MSEKADIWALGCCLFYLVTKRDPFTCDDPKENAKQIKKNIRQVVLDMPEYLNLDSNLQPRHEIVQQLIQACELLQELSNEHKAYESILTDPDILADYTCEFFGENGPHPIPDEVAPVMPQGVQQVGQQYQQQAAPARPQMPVPPQPQAAANAGDFWNSFGNLADRDPSNAWRYLNSAQQNPEVFRNKLLVME